MLLAGSAVARQAVGAVGGMFGGGGSDSAPAGAATDGGPAASTQMASTGEACEVDKSAFYACLKGNAGEADKCSDLFNALSMCQENAKYSSSASA